MPLLSSTTALAVYTVADPSAVTAEKLQQFAFRPIDDIPETRGWGWVNIEDMFDTAWHAASPSIGEYICFSLRIDSRKVSSAVLKKHLTEALRAEEDKAAVDGYKVSRSRKKDLKEALQGKLLSQAEPVPASIDVAVNTTNGQIFVSSVSGAHLELFEEYFNTSFGQTPERWLLEPDHGQNVLTAIYETSLAPSVNDHTWQLEQAGQAALGNTETGAMVTAKDEPEAVDKALTSGLVFTKLKCMLTRQDDESLEWVFTLGADGTLAGVKTPKVEKETNDSADAVLLEKLYLLEQMVNVIQKVTDAE